MSCKLEKAWTDTIDRSKTDKNWHGYDAEIKTAVGEFDNHLKAIKGYSLDWKLIKAMLWTESGGPSNTAWTTRPMQIGNPGDPGLGELLAKGRQTMAGGWLVMPPALASTLTAQNAHQPAMNIRAGIAYLLLLAMKSAYHDEIDTRDSSFHTYTVIKGDYLDKIARRVGTTSAILKKLSPVFQSREFIKEGDTLRYQKASVKKYITGFKTIDSAFCALKYNTGDPCYDKKLQYCLTLI